MYWSHMWQIPLLLCCSMACLGCGSSGRNLPTAPVTGTVTYSKPFPKGEVIFKHPSGELTVAKFQADGKYQATVPLGANLIMVRSQTSSFAEGGRPGGQQEIFTDHIPRRYGDFSTSKLEYTVKESDNLFDIALTEK